MRTVLKAHPLRNTVGSSYSDSNSNGGSHKNDAGYNSQSFSSSYSMVIKRIIAPTLALIGFLQFTTCYHTFRFVLLQHTPTTVQDRTLSLTDDSQINYLRSHGDGEFASSSSSSTKLQDYDHAITTNKILDYVLDSQNTNDKISRAEEEEEEGDEDMVQQESDIVTLLLISNQVNGMIPTIASIIKRSSQPVSVIVIGEDSTNNALVANHFGTRLLSFTGLTIQDVESDLLTQDVQPIWTWPEWHSSIRNNKRDTMWMNDNTIHPGLWDDKMKHAHVLNHIRYYIPYLSMFQNIKSNRRSLFYVQDDVIVQNDLARVQQQTLRSLQSKTVFISSCNMWMWSDECHQYKFHLLNDEVNNSTTSILQMPALYGNRQSACQSTDDVECVPEHYGDLIVNQLLPSNANVVSKQIGWNLGLSLLILDNWKANQITAKYEYIMKQNYRLHVFPETSLSFGLGVAYLALAGHVQCWDDNVMKVRDGFGFIEWENIKETFDHSLVDEDSSHGNIHAQKDDQDVHPVFTTIDVVHYSSLQKPWEANTRIGADVLQPWLSVMESENMMIPEQLSTLPTDNIFLLLGSSRTGIQWITSKLDQHADICATGEADNVEAGYPYDSFNPTEQLSWYPACSIRRGCSLSFVRDSITDLVVNTVSSDSNNTLPDRCQPHYDAESNNDPLKFHLKRLCNFIKVLDGNYSIDHITQQWIEAFATEKRDLLGCGCPRGTKAKGIKVLSDWIHDENYPMNSTGPADIDLSNTLLDQRKVIRIKRKNLWARYLSMEIAKKTNVWHVTTSEQKKEQLAILRKSRNASSIEIDLDDMKWSMKHMEKTDRAGDAWVKDHASDILWVEYDDCRKNTELCFESMHQFLGVDSAPGNYNINMNDDQSFTSAFDVDESLQFVRNKEEVRKVLLENDWGYFIGLNTTELKASATVRRNRLHD